MYSTLINGNVSFENMLDVLLIKIQVIEPLNVRAELVAEIVKGSITLHYVITTGLSPMPLSCPR